MEPKQTVSIEVSIDKDLKQELDGINKTIFDMGNNLLQARKAILDGEERYRAEEIVMMNNIALETTDEGKKKYSNEQQRRQHFIELMEVGHPLATLKKQLCEDREKVDLQDNEYHFLKRKLHIYDITTRR